MNIDFSNYENWCEARNIEPVNVFNFKAFHQKGLHHLEDFHTGYWSDIETISFVFRTKFIPQFLAKKIKQGIIEGSDTYPCDMCGKAVYEVRTLEFPGGDEFWCNECFEKHLI